MDELMIVATEHGVARCRRAGQTWEVIHRGLADHDVTAIMAREGVILAGTTQGIFCSDDAGDTWTAADDGLAIGHIRWMAYHPEISDLEFAGTEPAGIFVSHNGAQTWQGRPEVEALRDRFHWFLPYSPEAGCVRGFAFHGDRAYAAVEVGGVLRSDDRGGTWRLAGGSTGEAVFDIPPAPLVHSDVHSVAGHPSSRDRVFAATAEGLYQSSDGGDTWTVSHAGSYCRAMWVDPADPDHLILSPSDSVRHMNGRIEESKDGGRSWTHVSEGLDLPWPHTMVERFIPLDDELVAVTNSGAVFVAPLDNVTWRRVLDDLPGVRAMAVL